ncbi:MAG: magnesium/cobalt transporter CorA [Bacteroidales bacterium]|nr:magnesium/cobalt transporter CorA [Bacteroidales bacterium]
MQHNKNQRRKNKKQPGLMPGSLVYTHERMQEHVSIQLIQYDEQEAIDVNLTSLDELVQQVNPAKVNWININGLHDSGVIEKIGSQFEIHPLVLEDILHTDHMPKLEDYGRYLFLTLKMLTYDNDNQVIYYEHVSMILGEHYLVTFQEKDGDLFDSIRENITTSKGLLRKRKADYLFYRLIDTIVDHYYIIIDRVEERLEVLEESLLANKSDGISEEILAIKKKLIFLRRNIISLRDEMRKVKQKDFQLIEKSTYSFLDDVLDHLNYLAQGLDNLRDVITSLMELQIAVASNKMNNVMKTLTIFATIFMPLTFIAGIYGMNFHFMPELGWKWGYPVVLGAMLLVAGILLWFVRKRKWL